MKKVPKPENDFMEGFSKWLESEQGQDSMEAMDYVLRLYRGLILILREKGSFGLMGKS